MAMGKSIFSIPKTPFSASPTIWSPAVGTAIQNTRSAPSTPTTAATTITDPNKYYMKAVLKYADTVRTSLQDNPIDPEIVLAGDIHTPPDTPFAPAAP